MQMLHQARVVGEGMWVGRDISLPALCPSQQPIHLLRPQFPSLPTITVFPFSTHFFPLPGYDSHWSPWTRLIISPSILPQVKIISSAFLHPLHAPLWFDRGAVILECLSSLFHRSIFNAASSSTIYLPIKINILCHASIFLPTVCDRCACRCAFVGVLSLHQRLPPYLNLHARDWARFILLHSQDGVC